MVIRFPFLPTDSSFSKENSVGRVFGVTRSSSLRRLSMVSSSHVTSCSSSHSSALGRGSSVSATARQVTFNSRDIPLTRLAAMQQHMETSGFSRLVARRIYSAKRSL